MSRGSFWLIAAVLFVATSVTHLWMIGSAPTGFFNDESSIGYNAYCIFETGSDEYGVHHPVFFRSIEDYKDPVLIYSVVPLIKLFGLNKAAVRLTSALYFICASIAFVFLCYEYCHNKWVALAGGALFAFAPWTFNFSRTVIGGYTPMLLGMILGWWSLLVAVRRKSWLLAVSAGMAWALAAYAHNIGRPMTALLIVCFLTAFISALIPLWRVFLTFLVSFGLSMVPMIISIWRNPHVLTARFQRISIFQQTPSVPHAILAVVGRYVEYFSPKFLFLHGDQILRHGTGTSGVLLLFLAPFVVVGLYSAVRRWSSSAPHRFVLLGLLVYPTAAALTIDHMHSGRSVNGVIFWVLTAVLGIHQLLVTRAKSGRVVVALVTFCGVVETAWFCRDYFGSYQMRARPWFETELTEAIEFCYQNIGINETFYISPSAFELQLHKDNTLELLVDENFHYYPAVLFFGRIPPRFYQRQGIPKDRVRLYDGVAPKPGLLLRRSILVMHEVGVAKYWLDRNTESVPLGATLIKALPCSSPGRYEVYRIP